MSVTVLMPDWEEVIGGEAGEPGLPSAESWQGTWDTLLNASGYWGVTWATSPLRLLGVHPWLQD